MGMGILSQLLRVGCAYKKSINGAEREKARSKTVSKESLFLRDHLGGNKVKRK